VAEAVPKYKQILEELRRGLASGKYPVKSRLPGEVELGAQFGVSRLTIQRVLKEMQIEGLVERRAGSGTYVRERVSKVGHLFGLLIPGLGDTEIFEPICQGMAKAGRNGSHALLWGDTNTGTGRDLGKLSMDLCLDYIHRGVSGVFFAPLEGSADKDVVNETIVERLRDARIPVVLLDRCVRGYPERCDFDLVGIDNRRAGWMMTRHLVKKGAKSLAFVARPLSAATVDARIAGYRDAGGNGHLLHWDAGVDSPAVIAKMMSDWKPDGIVCGNDATAAGVMKALEAAGYRVPGQVRIVGIDDVRYAKLLPVPLTTLRQPCLEIGEMAVQLMLSRIANPSMPARDVLLDCELVVRESCGRD
jgi:GntR family transcriptional regulator, arabinose operon transcriptional repressor